MAGEYWAKNDHAALQKLIDKSMKYTACILLPIGLAVGFFAKDIITMIFGEGFVYAILPLQILIVGTVAFGLVKAIGGCVTGVGRHDIGLKMVGISATINIVLNILLIPYLGIKGAAIATTTSLSVTTLLWLFLTVKIVKVKIDFKWLAKLSGITLLAILVFMSLGFANRYLVGAIILFTCMFITYAFLLTKEDRTYFIDMVRGARSFLKGLV